MKICLVSRSWPSNEHSGVSLAAQLHADTLHSAGHSVSLVGAHASILKDSSAWSSVHYVKSIGSGALYSRSRVDQRAVNGVLVSTKPDLVLVECWQTGISEAFINEAFRAGIPTVMISHGLGIGPFDQSIRSKVRALGWALYRRETLPRLIGKIAAITALDISTDSDRFIDRDLALGIGIPVFELRNTPIHWDARRRSKPDRQPIIAVIGYFSEIKNQLAAIDVANALRSTGYSFVFIGPKVGSYYRRCVDKVASLKLDETVTFRDDTELDLGVFIGSVTAVLSTSLTEALPINLLEAMASGTPFVARPVGAVPGLRGGLVARTTPEQVAQLERLINDGKLWASLALEGAKDFELHYTKRAISKSLLDVVNHFSKQ